MFCWTRFGTEAGESIADILRRKERERLATDGVFYWGIGTSVAPGIAELVRRCERPEVLFSPMRSRPRAADVRPSAVARWTTGESLWGDVFDLPATVRVTSRHDPARGRGHYALVCRSSRPLDPADHGTVQFECLRNLASGSPLGASQVTAVVERLAGHPSGVAYTVALRAELVAPYFVRLRDPVGVRIPSLAA
jgi:hypothetical protein